jgi:endonuclease-3
MPISPSNRKAPKKKLSAKKQWKGAPSKRSATTATLKPAKKAVGVSKSKKSKAVIVALQRPVLNQQELTSYASVVVERLLEKYSDSKCSLDFETPFQLLVATALSAQCTDARVNKVTPELFRRYPDAKSMAVAPLETIEELVRTTGFYKNKAKNLISAAQKLVEKYDGVVPRSVEELSALPGVGRKTANVILGNAFGIPSMVVDTHVTRLSNRLGLAQGHDAVKLEHELEKVINKKHWIQFSHLLIYHGRAICDARKPQCQTCFLADVCPKLPYQKK